MIKHYNYTNTQLQTLTSELIGFSGYLIRCNVYIRVILYIRTHEGIIPNC